MNQFISRSCMYFVLYCAFMRSGLFNSATRTVFCEAGILTNSNLPLKTPLQVTRAPFDPRFCPPKKLFTTNPYFAQSQPLKKNTVTGRIIAPEDY